MESAAQWLSEKYRCGIYGATDIRSWDCAVLPIIPAGTEKIPAPFLENPLDFSVVKSVLKKGGVVFSGNTCPLLEKVCTESNFTLINYLKREELAVANAFLTAESAAALAVNTTETSIFGSEILVTGFGRIAKPLARYLKTMGAAVTVACRKKSDRKWAELYGFSSADITDKTQLSAAVKKADLIFNTVPCPVFGSAELNGAKKNAVYFELASTDGIIAEAKENTDIKIITARGLPGKTAPVTAGYIIAEAIDSILSERSDLYEP